VKTDRPNKDKAATQSGCGSGRGKLQSAAKGCKVAVPRRVLRNTVLFRDATDLIASLPTDSRFLTN
jgi:hypothetical protein